jgi:hypothetical protein
VFFGKTFGFFSSTATSYSLRFVGFVEICWHLVMLAAFIRFRGRGKANAFIAFNAFNVFDATLNFQNRLNSIQATTLRAAASDGYCI